MESFAGLLADLELNIQVEREDLNRARAALEAERSQFEEEKKRVQEVMGDSDQVRPPCVWRWACMHACKRAAPRLSTRSPLPDSAGRSECGRPPLYHHGHYPAERSDALALHSHVQRAAYSQDRSGWQHIH